MSATLSTSLKTCAKCGNSYERTIEHWYFRQGRAHGYCRSCTKSTEQREVRREYARNLRLECIAHYGNQCACCSVETNEFLSIDHIQGGGNLHRKQLNRQGTTIYLWLKKNGFPEGFQVLCHNCNMAKGFYGTCPHQLLVLNQDKE